MNVLRKGSEGALARRWQLFLRGQGIEVIDDGDFGKTTDTATKRWQKKVHVKPDGVVGNRTMAVAMGRAFGLLEDAVETGKQGPSWRQIPRSSSRSSPTPSDSAFLFGAATRLDFGGFVAP